jgi:predicted RNA-binding Zn-ribbon protein involved in translation (DUF1610 family)
LKPNFSQTENFANKFLKSTNKNQVHETKRKTNNSTEQHIKQGTSMSETKKCYSCGTEMQFAQRIPFRIKGTPGLYKLFIGEWGELGEEMLNFNVYVCPSCGEIRLSVDEKTKRRLLGTSFLKKCVKCGKEIPIASEECQCCGTKQPVYKET